MTAPDPKMLSASGTAGSTEPPHMPYSAVKMPYSSSQIHQHIPPCPGLMPSDGQVAQAPLQKSSSPYRRSFTQQKDHYDQMIHTGLGRMMKTTPQFSGYLIVWDTQKQKWDDWNNPEEKIYSPAGPRAPSSNGYPINIFSKNAGTWYKYVEVLNLSKPANSGLAPKPADTFVQVAPVSMSANLFVPCSAPNDEQPLEGSEGGDPEQNSPKAAIAPRLFNPTLLPPVPTVPAVSDSSKSGEMRQRGYVHLWHSLHHATTKILKLGALTTTMCRSLE